MTGLDNKDSPRILVTGGAGYIGSHTVAALAGAGFRPVIVDDFSSSRKSVLEGLKWITGEPVKCYTGDCCDSVFLDEVFAKEPGLSGVIHFAARKAVGESREKPLEYYRNNLVSLLNVLELMEIHGVRDCVFSSSATVYGETRELPVTEDTPFNPPENPYGATKQMCEQILRDVHQAGKPLRIVALRYFNPIGAHPSARIGELPLGVPNNLVPFVTQAAAGKLKELTVFGGDYDTPDGTCLRDYIHVVDLADAHVAALKYMARQTAPFHDVFNVGTGQANSVREVLETFEKVTGVPVPYRVGDRRPGDIMTLYAAVNKAREKLGWTSRHTLADALGHAWAWESRQ